VSAADTNRPDTVQPSGYWPQFEKQRTATASAADTAAAGQTPAAVSGCPAGCGRTAAPSTLGLLVGAGHAGQVDAAGRYPRSGRADTGRRLPDTGSPRAPGAADTRDRRRDIRTPRQRARWTAGAEASPTTAGVRPERDRKVRHRPARPPDRQIRRLVITVDLVGSRHIWPAQVGCLVDPDGSRRILWIRGMIKRPGAEHHSWPGGSARLPSGPILTMNRRGTAVLSRVFAARTTP
jgi:hypothetical protein